MSKGRQRYAFTIRRGEDGGYAVELEGAPTVRGLGGLGDLFQLTHLYVTPTAQAAGDQVAALLAEGEVDDKEGPPTCSKDKA